MDGYSPWSLAAFVGLILIAAIYYGFETALDNINESALEKKAEEGDQKSVKLLHILDKPERFSNTRESAVAILGVAIGAYVLGSGYRFLTRLIAVQGTDIENGSVIAVLVTFCVALVLLILYLVFGVLIPKTLAGRHPEAWAYRLYRWVSCSMVILWPLTALTTGISHLILRLFGVDPFADPDNVTEEEIMSMVNEGHEQGVLEANEAEMITKIFEFGDKEAGDIMTHRTAIIGVDQSLTLEEAVEFMLQQNYSRFPVYSKDIDDVTGVLYLKDAVICRESMDADNVPIDRIDGLIREAHFIPETRNIDTIFQDMRVKKIHLAIVVDEYGQTAGLITLEDILEEIVGNIFDEYDEEESVIQKMEDGVYLIDGLAPLEEVGESLGIEFDEEDFDTLNGFLISSLDRIPKDGEQPGVDFGGYEFEVLSVENKMIHTVRVCKKAEDVETETQDGE